MFKGLQSLLRAGADVRGQAGPAHSDRPGILIVEEDHALAVSLGLLLDNAGYRVVGTVRSVAELAVRMASSRIDLAIIDQSGDGSVAFQAVALLQRWGVPFVFVGSHCTDRAFPSSLADVPRLGGAPWAADVLQVIAAALGANDRPGGPACLCL